MRSSARASPGPLTKALTTEFLKFTALTAREYLTATAEEQDQSDHADQHDRTGHHPYLTPLEPSAHAESVHHDTGKLRAQEQAKAALGREDQRLHGPFGPFGATEPANICPAMMKKTYARP